jgi:hypothetical protein
MENSKKSSKLGLGMVIGAVARHDDADDVAFDGELTD